MLRRIKNWCFTMLEGRGVKGAVFRAVMLILILFSGALLAAETFAAFADSHARLLTAADSAIVLAFTAEYLLRLWTADLRYPNRRPLLARLRFVISPMAVVDLLSILPFYALRWDTLRILRLLRVFRVLKAGRYAAAFTQIGRVLRYKGKQIVLSMGVVVTLIFVAAILMYQAEHAAQPERFSNVFSALWWSVVTLTTTGYGDIYPITPLGKCLSMLVSLLGIGLIALPTGIISAGFVELNDGKRKVRCFCPYCGSKIEYEEHLQHEET